MEGVLGAVTLVSFALAVWQTYKMRREERDTRANLAVLTTRAALVSAELEGAFTTVNALVQLPKTRDVSDEEVQNVARIARTQVLISARALKQQQELLGAWSTGSSLAEVLASGSGSLRSSEDAPAGVEPDA